MDHWTITCTCLCDYIVKYFSTHLAGVSVSFAGFEEASSHLVEPHVGRNYGIPQGVKGSVQPSSSKEMKQMQGSEFCQQLHELGRGP